MDQMTPREEIEQFLSEAGFRNTEHHIVMGCFSEYRAVR
jgi:hypothetical protein